MLVGEQPGDREDVEGAPFVGPAGRELDRALEEAGIDRVAAQALVGRHVRVTQDRGRPLDSPLAPCVMATVHPSSILRAPDETSRREAHAAFVADLAQVAAVLDGRD